MTLCAQLKEEFLNEIELLISGWKETSIRLASEGSKDEGILETIKANVGEIFFTLFNVSYKNACKNGDTDDIELSKLSKAYFDFFDKIPKPWKEKMVKDKEHNMMEEYYKEQIKLETAEQIKNLFIKYYDRFYKEVKMETDCLKIFKCLGDKSRLSIINNLIEGPMYVELLSERLNLASSTISFHLKKLEEVNLVYSVKEQYYVVYHLNNDMLSLSLTDLINIGKPEKDTQTEREEQYKRGVINSFFEYEKLQSIPVQQKKRKIILEEIAKKFQIGKEYSEREVNIIIADFHDDFCTIRREMVGFNILEREHGIYKLVN